MGTDEWQTLRPDRPAVPGEGDHWDAYVWVADADAVYAEFVAKWVAFTRGICDQFHGCRDFDVEDCNGYRLCFGRRLGG